eukprot:TCONS_00003348-protein
MEVEVGIKNSIWNDGISKFIKTPEPFPVHNHLIDTKIYAAIGENELLHTRPSSIHFRGFQVGKKYTQKLRIVNASSECQRMLIVPPSSSNFQIQYQKKDSLVPGMYLEVDVIFTPKTNEYQQDAIRIHSQTSSNLIVPIHAYLQINISSTFPSKINFRPTVVGQKSQKKIPLNNPTSVDFDFHVSFAEKHTSFVVEPSSGVIPANGHVLITLTYNPTEYCTSCAKLQVIVAQFNNQPHFCSLMGSSVPGLASKKKLEVLPEQVSEKILDPRTISPLERTRAKKKVADNTFKSAKTTSQKTIVKDGIQFSTNLNNTNAVNHVLMQKAGQMKAKELREVIRRKTEDDIEKEGGSHQMKEAVFEHLVGRNIAEEQRNQLRWCVRIGERDLEESTQSRVFNSRQQAEQEFQVFRRDGNLEAECNRSTTQTLTNQRIIRSANQHADATPTFDLYLNNEWDRRHRVLTKFIQATRKVIIRNRAKNNIQQLTLHLDSWRRGNFQSAISQKPKYDTNKELEIVEDVNTVFNQENIKSFSFPEYQDPDKKTDMAIDALGSFDMSSTSVKVKRRIETYKLKVPQQYKTLSYSKHHLTNSVRKYIPKSFARTLRVGAESEIIQSDHGTTLNAPLTADRTTLDDIEPQSVTVKFSVPTKFLEPNVYHPLHIFNPLPGVQGHAQKMLYSEVDDDHKLCPLVPRMTSNSNGEDVVPGVMDWKKFPSQALMSISLPTLANCYLPRWSDPFGEDLCSSQTPSLMTSLPPDDVMDIDEHDEEYEEARIVPTLDMIRHEFHTQDILSSLETTSFDSNTQLNDSLQNATSHLPQLGNSGHLQRDGIQTTLDAFLKSKQNALGERMKSRVQNLQSDWSV